MVSTFFHLSKSITQHQLKTETALIIKIGMRIVYVLRLKSRSVGMGCLKNGLEKSQQENVLYNTYHVIKV